MQSTWFSKKLIKLNNIMRASIYVAALYLPLGYEWSSDMNVHICVWGPLRGCACMYMSWIRLHHNEKGYIWIRIMLQRF